MKRAVTLVLLLCAACSRDLALPAATLPPEVDAVVPNAGFAGEAVTIQGKNLGDLTLQVFFGLRAATVVTAPLQRDSLSVVVLVPDGVDADSVAVVGAQGEDEKSGLFTFRGPGHPRSMALRSVVPLGPNVRWAAPLADGSVFALLDTRYGTLLPVTTDGTFLKPIAAGAAPAQVFGAAVAPWVLDLAAPALGHFDLVASAEIAADRIALPALAPRLYAGAAGSPGGSWFALPMGAAAVQLYPLSATSRAPFAVALAGARPVLGVQFADDGTLVGMTEDQLFRIDLRGAVPVLAVSSPIAFPAARPAKNAPLQLAVAAATGRIAYLRADGRVGVGHFTGPSLDTDAGNALLAADPLIDVQQLAISDDGNTLLAMSSRAELLAFDLTDPALALSAAQTIPGLSSVTPIGAGPAKGRLLAGISDPGGSALLFNSGQPIRIDTVPMFDAPAPGRAPPKALAVMLIGSPHPPNTPDPLYGQAAVATRFGPLLINPITLGVTGNSVGFLTDGLNGGPGGIVAWSGSDLYVPTTDRHWRKIGSLPFAPDDAALSPDGRWVSASGLSGASSSLRLLPRLDAPAGPSPRFLNFPGKNPVPLGYAGPTLVAGHDETDGYQASAYLPGTLDQTASIKLAAPPTGLHYSTALNAFLIDVPTGGVLTSVLWGANGNTAVGTAPYPGLYGQSNAISADGRLLLSISADPYQRAPGLDSVFVELVRNKLELVPFPHVDLPGRPSLVTSSPEGARLYVLMPDKNAVAIIE